MKIEEERRRENLRRELGKKHETRKVIDGGDVSAENTQDEG